jgi:hypothetical protein
MPVFMKIDGIDSVGRQESVKDGTSNTLMIGEHVLTSVSHAATDVLDELFYSPKPLGAASVYSSSASKTFLTTPPAPRQARALASRASASTADIWGAASI